MKYYVKKTGEAFHSEMTFDEIQADFKAGKIPPDWGVRREDDGDYDWVTVQQLCASGLAEPTAKEVLQSIPPVRYRDYSEVPWHRKSSSNGILILINLLTCGLVPGTFLVCCFVLTGDIYYNKKDDQGNLKTWSWGNKVAAIILLAINVIFLISALLGAR